MLLKLLWLVVIAWIIHRVWIAGRNLFHIAAGREGVPVQEGRRASEPGADRASRGTEEAQRTTVRPKSDVEDARWVDL